MPSVPEVSRNISGLIRGELIQKAMIGASGTPPVSMAAISGRTPQEQNGTVAPASAAPATATFSLRVNTTLIVSEKPETVAQAEADMLSKT